MKKQKKENWEKTHYPCRACLKEGKKEKATVCFRPDLDLKGLCYCDKHKEAGKLEYIELIYSVKS